jgi:hypothetical protein
MHDRRGSTPYDFAIRREQVAYIGGDGIACFRANTAADL